ncbi:hypothetical protein [uncultured Bacteroides sp.]|uniref:hypothetical protein n=1 Tax=uncultured Bacteroides sp. TaxID=162156 RepID=UPI002AAB70DE|nr:hypothetical protein [uncultured Bacteroides sp.]
MGTAVEEKVLDIKVRYEDAIRGIAKYRTELDVLKKVEATLKDDLKNGRITREQYNVKLAESKITSNEYKEAIRGLEKETRNNIKAEKEQQGSLVSLRGSLSNLTKQYDEMSEAERNSASGKDLAIHINAITDKLKDAEEGTQRFYRNVGNYEEAFSKALSPMKKKLDDMTTAYMNMSKEERQSAKGDEMRQHMKEMKEQISATSEAGGKFQNELLGMAGIQGGLLGSITGSVGGLTSMSQAFMAGKAAVSAFSKQLLALLANPIVAILAGIALVIMGVVKAIKSSEDATNRISVLFAPVTRLLDGLMSILQKGVGYILSFVESGMKMYDWAMKMMEKLPFVGGAIKKVNDANSEAIALAKEKIAIEEQSRKDEVENAKSALEVAQYRTQAKDKEKFTAKERLKFVREANKLEEEQSKRNVELAERKLKALKIESSWAENNAETNKKLASLEADVYNARKEYFDKTRRLKEEENTLINENKADEKARLDAAKNAAKEAASVAKERGDKELEAVRTAQDAMLALLKDGVEKQRKTTTLSYDREIEDLKTKLVTEKNLTVDAKKALNDTIKALEEKKQQELKALSDEEITKDIEKEQKRIELMLAAVKSGSEQESQLKLDLMQKQMEAELSNTELTEEQKSLIREKYRIQEDALIDEHTNNVKQKQLDAINLDYETQIAQAYGNEQAVLQLKMEQKEAELNALQQMEGESMEAFNLRRLNLENEYTDAKKAVADKEIEIEQTKFQATADITNSLSTLADAASEHSKALAMASKVLALAEIAINTGKAIAAGVAQAQSVPFPANIAAIATTISTVLANIATATKTVKSAKFATGGYVSGEGSGTSDSIPAQLSNGESVMTATATSMFAPMLSAFNTMGGGVPINITANSSQAIGEEMLARAVAKGFMMAPSPVLSVEEFTSVANRTKYIESIGDI